MIITWLGVIVVILLVLLLVILIQRNKRTLNKGGS